MPTYLFKNNSTGREEKIFMSISERDKYVVENTHMTQLVHGFPSDADSYRLGRTKPADGFKDLLGQINRNNYGANVRTFK